MSGGSYNYLFLKDPEELIHYFDELEEMRKRLLDLGYDDAANSTGTIMVRIKEFFEWLQYNSDRLSGVWKAVEWMDSGDWGIESVEKAMKEYREGCKPHV